MMKKRRLLVFSVLFLFSVFSIFSTFFVVHTYEKSESTQTIITESKQHLLDNVVAKQRNNRVNLLDSGSGISASENSRPPKDFIDVSSHNGYLSVEAYETMKNYGITGVVVKLTEGDSYRNPLAPEQVANAIQAGLKVSVYHYAWFNYAEDTEKEAYYLLAYLKELNLPYSTVVVNDSENPQMNLARVTENAQVFSQAIQAAGFSQVVHYSNLSWFTNGTLDLDVLGKENCWVAQWPQNPSENELLHTEKAAWQWASDLYFPEFTEKQFDINTDYLGIFTK